jgi:sortase A
LRKERNVKRRIIILFVNIIGLLLIFGGLFIFLRPSAIQWSYDSNTESQLGEYRERNKDYKAGKSDARLEELYRLMVEYNQSLFQNGQAELVDPFSYENADINLIDYGFEEDIVGFLKIPKLNLNLPVYLGASQENLEKGAALLSKTSMPVGGINTNAVIAAHRASHLRMFKDIPELKQGDKIFIENFREALVYEVVQTEVILPSEIDRILIREGKDMVTLITCHPYTYTYQRYVVYCERVELSGN